VLGRMEHRGSGGETADRSWYVFDSLWNELWSLTKVLSIDRIKVRRAMESSLQKTAMKIVNIVNKDKDHIPPITTSEANPFPYRIVVNPKEQQTREERFGGAKAYERGGYGGGWS
jgi:hypothetical protein